MVALPKLPCAIRIGRNAIHREYPDNQNCNDLGEGGTPLIDGDEEQKEGKYADETKVALFKRDDGAAPNIH